MADQKLSEEDLLASVDVLDNLRIDVTYTNPVYARIASYLVIPPSAKWYVSIQ